MKRRLKGSNTDAAAAAEEIFVGNNDENENKLKKTVLKNKEGPLSLTNLLWFFGSAVVFYYSNIVNIFLYNKDLNRTFAYSGLGLILTNVLIGLFLVIWLTHVKKIDPEEWTKYYPSLIPVATTAFIFGSIMLTIGLWPVYGFLTAPILFTIFMGVIIIIINLPSWV